MQRAAEIAEVYDRRSNNNYLIRILSVSALILYLIWPKYFVVPGLGINPYTASVALLVICWIVITIVYNKLFLVGVRPSILFFIFLCLLFWEAYVGMFFDAADTYSWLRQLVQVKALFFVGVIISGYLSLRALLKTLYALILVNAIIGGIEFITGTHFAQILSSLFGSAVQLNVGQLLISRMSSGSLRVQATLDHPIIFGAMCGIGFSTGLYVLLSNKSFKNFSFRSLVIYFSLLMLLVGVYVSGSRSSILALGCSVYFYGLLLFAVGAWRGSFISLVFLIALPVAGALFAAPYAFSLADGLTEIQQQSSLMREVMWDRAAYYIDRSPFFGYGFGQALPLAGFYRAETGWTLDDSYLTMILDGGYLYLFLNIVFCSLVIFCAAKNIAISKGSFSHEWIVVSSIILSVLAVQKFNSIPYLWGVIFLFGGYICGYSFVGKSLRGNGKGVLV